MSQILSLAGFELRYHLRRPVTYVFMAAMFMLAFLFATTDAVQIGGVGGKVVINSPWVVNTVLLVFTLVGMIMTSAIAGTAILRDFELKAHELLFTTRLSKPAFVFGRFLGAYAVTVLVFACSALGLWLAVKMPWIDPDKVGPGGLGVYLRPILLYVLPNALLVSALFFAVGVLTRSFIAVYVQGVVLFVGYSVALTMISDLDNETVAALLDPLGLIATNLVQRDWTVAEKNTLLMPLAGLLLANRALWSGVGILALAGAYRLFRMEAFAGARRRGKPEAAAAELPEVPRSTGEPLPAAAPRSGAAASLQALAAMVPFYYRNVVRDRAFVAIAAVGMLMTVTNAFNADLLYGTTTYPVTYAMLDVIGSFALFFLILTALYSGELVWRERGLRCDQILDATPVASAHVFAAKIAALLLVHATLLLALIAAGVAVQTIKGYFDYELGLYFGYLFGFVFPGLVLVTLLAFVLQVLADNKFVGNALVVLYYILTLVLGAWGLDHRLYRYGAAPDPTYSAMNGYGPDVPANLWFTGYYLAFALLLLAVAGLLLVRGTPPGGRARLRAARARLTPRWFAFAGAALLAWLGLGAFIYYNTNVLHTYRSSDAAEALQAEYERTYKQYETLPQPRIVASAVSVDLYPAAGHMRTRGSYTLTNRSGVAIDRVHLQINPAVTIHELAFSRPAEVELDDPRIRYQIHRLAAPLAPGEGLTLRFDVGYDKVGFSNDGGLDSLAENGSFFNNVEFLPSIGYARQAELADDDKRKEQGLPPRERMPSIDDMAARQTTYIARDSDWIDFTASVCTSPDQIAVAPGYLQGEFTRDGRRCFSYAMDRPILHFYSFLSARYEVLRDKWRAVDIEIYYHRGHEYNLARMVDAVKKSLDYFTANFSPYQHRQVRILEFPRYARFAQSFPNTIPFSESIGFIARVRPDDPEDIDYPFYVTAHEVAHQWWAHQVIGADVQGSTMLSESLSQYSALMVMEKEYGRDKMKRFLAYELRNYLSGRSREKKKELPLMLVEDQGYIHYNKGALVFYALRDYLGEDVLNAALARYIAEVGEQRAPFTTSRDLLAILREVTPPQYQYLLHDMFETITLYDNKVLAASATPRPDGKFDVHLELGAHKLLADDLGEEKKVPIADYIDVGVFGAPLPGDELGKPLYLERHKLERAVTSLDVVVEEAPVRAGIDPYNKLIDRKPRDNTQAL